MSQLQMQPCDHLSIFLKNSSGILGYVTVAYQANSSSHLLQSFHKYKQRLCLTCTVVCVYLCVLLTLTTASLVWTMSEITPSVIINRTKYWEPSVISAAQLGNAHRKKHTNTKFKDREHLPHFHSHNY